MESFPLFFRIRAITFTCVMLFSFLWLVLLCVEIFARWSVSDQISQSLMVLFILTNTITLIMLPILILVQFRIWLDAARLLLLSVLQVGSAAAGTFWSPRIQCPDQTPDDIGVCQLIGVYTMMACWVIPAILVFYSTYFAVVVYLQSRIPVVVEPKLQRRRTGVDLELGSTDSLLWKGKMKEIVEVQGSNADMSVPPRPLVSPTMIHSRQSSLPQSSIPQRQSILPNIPRRQSSLLYTCQQPLLPPSVPSRHYSLPAFRHDNGPHHHRSLTLSVPRPLPTNVPPSHSQAPSSANLQNQPFTSGPSAVGVQSSRYGFSRHLSMMPLSSSPREIQSDEGSLTARPTRAKLSKPLPSHLL